MIRGQVSVVLLIATLVVVTSCADSRSPAPSTSLATTVSAVPPAAATLPSDKPEDVAADAALRTYERYWQIGDQAEAAPRAKDWRADLATVMADPALTLYVKEIQNLASVPAHAVGEYQRAPKVTVVSLGQPPRVTVTDCLDATNDHLISDKPDEVGKTLDNPSQPQRYELDVQIVLYPNPNRWLVQSVEPRLEKPC